MSFVPGSDAPRPSGPGVKLTYDDFVHFPDDGKRWACLKGHPVGEIFGAPFDVVFSDFDVVEPDLLFVSSDRSQVLTEKNVQGAPDLVVEIGAPATRRRDEKTKLQLYERFGVQEYWVVDPDLDVIKVYRLVEGRYQRTAELTLADHHVLSTPLIPGLELSLADIFPE